MEYGQRTHKRRVKREQTDTFVAQETQREQLTHRNNESRLIDIFNTPMASNVQQLAGLTITDTNVEKLRHY
jgi:hypothetical protein